MNSLTSCPNIGATRARIRPAERPDPTKRSAFELLAASCCARAVPGVRLFVYGSLRRGRSNHPELAGASFIRSLATAPRCALVERDGYPALVPGCSAVEGELYAVTYEHLARLDAFEGSGYVRAKVTLADGSAALAYWLAGEAR